MNTQSINNSLPTLSPKVSAGSRAYCGVSHNMRTRPPYHHDAGACTGNLASWRLWGGGGSLGLWDNSTKPCLPWVDRGACAAAVYGHLISAPISKPQFGQRATNQPRDGPATILWSPVSLYDASLMHCTCMHDH
jgi:hypothetical protein